MIRKRRTLALMVILGFMTRPGFCQPLLSSNLDVILVVGMAGEVESETSFQGYLQNWIEILNSGGHVRNITVLTENPSSISPAGGVVASFIALPSTRANLLQLTETLNTPTNPVLVVAFGHGGRQGSKPVFHVRGPLITPGDFEALAAKVGRTDSRWLLFFRGSGAFARQLVAERRQILSSEADTMFASDPIGMPLLLKILKTNPELPFEGLAERLGRATAQWYEERHLARTEEPTFWNEKAGPAL